MSEHATETEPTEAEQAFIDSLPTGMHDEQAVEAPAADETAASAEEGTTEADPLAIPDSFTPQDVKGMLEAIDDPAAKAVAEAAYKNLQADYTRSKQELSEQAKAYEGFDPEQAKAAVEFYNGIQNDPEFAMEVRDYLTKVFEESGMSQADAAEAADQEMQTPASQVETPSFDDDPDAALKARQDELDARLSKWEQADQARQAEQREAELAAELLRQEMAIRSQFEPKSEADSQRLEQALDVTYDLAGSMGGNLLEAWEKLQAYEQATISSYMAQKQTSLPPAEPSSGSAQPPPEFPRLADGSVDMEAIHKVAEQKLRNAMAGRD